MPAATSYPDRSLRNIRSAMAQAAQACGESAAMQDVLKQIAIATGSASAYVFAPYRYAVDSGMPASDVGMQFQFGMPSGFFTDYAQRVWKLDPWRVGLEQALPKLVRQGGVVGSDHISSAQLRRTEFYCDYLKPQIGLEQMLCAMLGDGHVLGLMRSTRARRFDRYTLAFVDQFKQEFEILANASHRVQKMSDALHWMDAALHATGVGLLDLHVSGRVLRANANACNWLGLPVAEEATGRLVPAHLRQGLTQAFGMSCSGGKCFWIQTEQGRWLQAHVVSRDLEQVQLWLAQATTAYAVQPGLFSLANPSGGNKAAPVGIASLKLTPAEWAVVQELTQGPPKQVARKLGIAVSTVRSHLSNIFEKTGTKTQSELLWLVGRGHGQTAARR